jgi:hypothetical protein
MTTAEAREQIGQFGKIHANGDNYPKEIYGRITEVDRTCLMFTDNDDFIYIFKVAKVISFEPKEFTPTLLTRPV